MVDNTEVRDYSSDSSTDNEGLLQKIKSKPRVAKEEQSEVQVPPPPSPPPLVRTDTVTPVEGEPPKKPRAKKPRTKKQIEAFEKANPPKVAASIKPSLAFISLGFLSTVYMFSVTSLIVSRAILSENKVSFLLT